MQLVIVAGGFGKRLRPLTLTRPKALIPLVDRPLVLHILDSLPPSCDEAIIAVNYLFEQVRDFFREHESRIAVRSRCTMATSSTRLTSTASCRPTARREASGRSRWGAWTIPPTSAPSRS